MTLHPRAFVDVSEVEMATTVLGREIALPVIAAPTGLTGLQHPDGEMAAARAAHAAGSIYTLSTMASYTLEEVADGGARAEVVPALRDERPRARATTCSLARGRRATRR